MKGEVGDGSDEHLLENGPQLSVTTRRRRWSLTLSPSIGELLLFLVSGVAVFAAGCLAGRSWAHKTVAACTDRPGSGILWRMNASGQNLRAEDPLTMNRRLITRFGLEIQAVSGIYVSPRGRQIPRNTKP